MLPDFTATWKPYSTDGATLDGTLKWLKHKVAAPRGIDPELAEIAQLQILSQVALGKSLLGPCSCGCGLTNTHTKIEHAMRDRLYALHAEREQVQQPIRDAQWHRAILEHIEADNQAALREYEREVLDTEIAAISPWQRIKGKAKRMWAIAREGA
jgi:hypothetical protein